MFSYSIFNGESKYAISFTQKCTVFALWHLKVTNFMFSCQSPYFFASPIFFVPFNIFSYFFLKCSLLPPEFRKVLHLGITYHHHFIFILQCDPRKVVMLKKVKGTGPPKWGVPYSKKSKIWNLVPLLGIFCYKAIFTNDRKDPKWPFFRVFSHFFAFALKIDQLAPVPFFLFFLLDPSVLFAGVYYKPIQALW